MTKLIPILFLILGLTSCSIINPTSTSAVDIESIENQSKTVSPNLNHGQHEAGYNAANYLNDRNRGSHRDNGNYQNGYNNYNNNY